MISKTKEKKEMIKRKIWKKITYIFLFFLFDLKQKIIKSKLN